MKFVASSDFEKQPDPTLEKKKPDPNFKENPDSDPTLEKPDSDPTLEKEPDQDPTKTFGSESTPLILSMLVLWDCLRLGGKSLDTTATLSLTRPIGKERAITLTMYWPPQVKISVGNLENK